MSIGKRFLNLVRSNLNAVLDRTTSRLDRGRHLEDLSDDELEAELSRRRSRRNAAERAANSTAGYSAEDWDEVERAVREGTGRYRRTGRRPAGTYRRGSAGGAAVGSSGRRGSTAAPDPRLAQLYAQLECPYGSDLTTVRKHYRSMMRKYHPDMHSGSPDKQRLATDLSQRLTVAYNELRRLLTPGGAA